MRMAQIVEPDTWQRRGLRVGLLLRRADRRLVELKELRHAVLLALTTAGFPAMVAALKWVDEVIENEST